VSPVLRTSTPLGVTILGTRFFVLANTPDTACQVVALWA